MFTERKQNGNQKKGRGERRAYDILNMHRINKMNRVDFLDITTKRLFKEMLVVTTNPNILSILLQILLNL